jgi:methenyltetrahydrofolate cyclohydrolase
VYSVGAMPDQYNSTLPGILSRPTEVLLNDFGAGRAAPGSGSASALMGLLVIKLLSTVCKKTIEKSVSGEKTTAFRYIEVQLKSIEARLVILFEKDAQEFDEVVRLRRERDTSSSTNEKAVLARQANTLLEVATNNVLEVAELCISIVDHAVIAFREGWGTVRGDSGAAISAAQAGATSSLFIYNLNIKTLENRNHAAAALTRSNIMQENLQQRQVTIFRCLIDINSEASEALQLDLQLRFEI